MTKTELLRRKQLAAVALFICLTYNSGLGQSPGQPSQIASRTVVIDLNFIDVRADVAASLERSVRDASSIARLVTEGKAKSILSLQMRSKSGEQASVRIGNRIPIQTGMAQAVPQISYENTGGNVDAGPEIIGEQIQIKLKVDISYVTRSQATAPPLFLQRSLSQVVRVRPGETVILTNAIEHEPLWPEAAPGSGPAPSSAREPAPASGNFAAVVTARIVE